MTTRVVHNGPEHSVPGAVKEIIISCDHIDCTVALNDTEIAKGGGLKALGWQTVPGDGKLKHYCPQHNR